MRLKEIKLSGFKTFVDPIRVHAAQSLVGVVGPNGCGKSNLVDAVSWVMGELSARRLRSETLADVIFNGSEARKPVGRAMVELVLDNSAGTVGGRYASMREISVRRVLDRDGGATYFLNGVACRRRDVQELFLGTGITPGSYAIIGQDMISRLVDSRPDELRLFLEDAAGVSRYRQQRRETLSRLRGTRENFNVLYNIRREVEGQLKKLQSQAKAAQRFQALCAEQRECEAALAVRDWERLREQLEQGRQAETRAATALEGLRAGLSGLARELREGQAERELRNEGYNGAQAALYELGGELSGLEQESRFLEQRLEEQRAELARGEKQDQRLREGLEQERREAQELRAALVRREPELAAARAAAAAAEQGLRVLETQLREGQSAWEQSLEEAVRQEQQLETLQARLEYLASEQREAEAQEREQQFALQAAKPAEAEQRVAGAREALAAAERERERLEAGLVERRAALRRCREQLGETEALLEEGRSRQQELESRFHSLHALQEAALGRDREAAGGTWPTQHGLAEIERLGELLHVEEGWECAVELVLGARLRDLVVEEPAIFHERLTGLEEGAVGLCRMEDSEAAGEPSLLRAKLRAPRPPAEFLEGVYCAVDLKQAQALLVRLEAGQSVVTRDGVWLGQGWARATRGAAGGVSGFLEREEEHQRLRAACVESRAELEALAARRRELRDRGTALERELDVLQAEFNQAQQESGRLRVELDAARAGREQLVEQRRRLEQESAAGSERRAWRQTETERLGRELEQGSSLRETLEQRRDQLAAGKEQGARGLDAARERWRESSRESHRLGLQVREQRSVLEGLERGLRREQEQLKRWAERREQLREELQRGGEKMPRLQERLQESLEERGRREQAVAEHRTGLEQQAEILRVLERKKTGQEEGCRAAEQELGRMRLAAGELRLRLESLEQELQRLEFSTEQARKAAGEAEDEVWRQRLERVKARLQRLGVVNPAAVEESEQLRERCAHLNSQLEDLEQAMANLDRAMHRIDRESRARFEDTFRLVNERLGGLFRRLFGGGNARLELLGDDPQQAGVMMLAQPPGKRNRNIQQLSGGEKALAALALVFAIFQLNPAPFCILDEVDAPLDDVNVARFLALLKELSETVQFLLVTHNKISMESMNILLGVTMPEAGISRVLSIALEEAAELAAAG